MIIPEQYICDKCGATIKDKEKLYKMLNFDLCGSCKFSLEQGIIENIKISREMRGIIDE